MKKYIFFIMLLLLTGCSSTKYENGSLNVLNWSSYIPDNVIKNFEDEYKIKVNYGTYSSNEELLAKVTSSKSGTYDVVFPSDYMVEIMKNKNLLDEIDKSKLENMDNINKLFLNQEYDRNNLYSLPFLATGVVIAVNREEIKDDIRSYNDLLREEYKNNIVMLDDQRIVIGIALMSLGYNMNETDINKLNEAKEWLLELKKNVKAYDSDSPKSFLMTRECMIGVMWNAEAYIAKENNPNIEIIYPSDGGALSVDNYVILKNSKNRDNAYLFIDYLLNYNVNKEIVDEYPYISTLSDSNYSKNEINNILQSSTYIKNIGESISLYDKVWASIK